MQYPSWERPSDTTWSDPCIIQRDTAKDTYLHIFGISKIALTFYLTSHHTHTHTQPLSMSVPDYIASVFFMFLSNPDLYLLSCCAFRHFKNRSGPTYEAHDPSFANSSAISWAPEYLGIQNPSLWTLLWSVSLFSSWIYFQTSTNCILRFTNAISIS